MSRIRFRTSVPIFLITAALSAPNASEPLEPPKVVDRTEGVGTVLEIAVPPEAQPFTPNNRGMRRVKGPVPHPEKYFNRDRNDPAFQSAVHEYLRFDEIPNFPRRMVLRQQGILLTDYVGDHTYIGAINAEGRRFLETASGITEIGGIPLQDKLDAGLLAGETHENAIGPSGRVLVDISFHRTVALDKARTLLEAHGGTVLDDNAFLGLGMMHAAMSVGAVESFAGEDAVAGVSMKRPKRTQLNQTAAQWSNTDVLWTAPYNLNGAGLAVSIFDDGAVHPHPEFGSRIIQYVDWSTPLAEEDYDSHATHGAGTIGAAGTLGPLDSTNAHGMANQVSYFIFDPSGYDADMNASINAGFIQGAWHGWGYDIGWWFFPGCDQSDGCLPPIPPQWVFNSSIGFGIYNIDTRVVDLLADFAEDSGQIYPIVFPAGNDRDDGPNDQFFDGTYHETPGEPRPYYDTIGPPGTAKNCITVGAVGDGFLSSSFSSWGPADDGRVKPDLVAKGYAHSPDGHTGYSTQFGTSTAAATVLGSSLLVIEEYQNVFATQPTNAELKALLLHTAKDLGHQGPDPIFGFGLLDTQAAVDFLSSPAGLFSIVTGDVDDNLVDSYIVNIEEGTPTLQATLAWMDAAAPSTVQGAHLVNDLDLRLVSPSGGVYYPWMLDAAHPNEPATRTGPNDIDTVEQVFVEFPEPGNWTVEVEGEFVPLGPQKYGVVSGIMSGPAVFDQTPPQVPFNYTTPYPLNIVGGRFADPLGVGIDVGSVQMHFWTLDVTGDSVITADGVHFAPPYDYGERDHYYSITVSDLAGAQTTKYAYFTYARAREVADLRVNLGGSGQTILSWGDSDYDPDVLWLAGFAVQRSTDLLTEMEHIATTTGFMHSYTDASPPAADLVFYEVHGLFEGYSGDRFMSIRNTEYRTQQPFIGLPRPSNLGITLGGTVQRVFGQAEPGSQVTLFVNDVAAGSTTATPHGSFSLFHDFGSSGPVTIHVQAKAEGKSISVPSVDIDFVVP